MRKINSLRKKLFLTVPLIFFLMTVANIGCNPGTDGQKENIAPADSCLMGNYFYELELSKGKYTALKNFLGTGSDSTSKLVFQFYFDNSTNHNPSLKAFASKSLNQFHKGGVTLSHELDITGNQSLAVPGKFVLGDQQISVDLINNLVRGAGDPSNYTLVFKPKQDASSNNIYYMICVKYKDNTGADREYCGGDPPAETQPSPPADAY